LKNKDFKGVVACTCNQSVANIWWMGQVFIEKLKALKVALKKLNVETYGELETTISSLITQIVMMELKGEVGELSVEEVKGWKEDCGLFWLLLGSRDSLEFQKTKAKWLKEKDANNFFISCVCKGEEEGKYYCGVKKG
jgi:hypothetical protein